MMEKMSDVDIIAITCLTRFNGEIFAYQDVNFTIRFARLKTMIDSHEETDISKLILLEIT